MIGVTELKNGTTFLSNGDPYKVIKYTLTNLGRGGATVRVHVRNLLTGAVVEKTFGSNNKVEEISTVKRHLQYLYHDGTTASFMDPISFEQIEVPLNVLGNDITFVKEGNTASVLFWEETPLSIDLPPK